jgi:hypothetical protein
MHDVENKININIKSYEIHDIKSYEIHDIVHHKLHRL